MSVHQCFHKESHPMFSQFFHMAMADFFWPGGHSQLPPKYTLVAIFSYKILKQINCSVYVTLPSHDMPGIGIQHLWVCSGHKEKGQVSIISLHTNQPCIVESFRVSESMVLCAEMVPGTSSQAENKWESTDETVWMATDDNKYEEQDIFLF